MSEDQAVTQTRRAERTTMYSIQLEESLSPSRTRRIDSPALIGSMSIEISALSVDVARSSPILLLHPIQGPSRPSLFGHFFSLASPFLLE